MALDGAAPANQPIRMNADPVCAKEAKGEQLQETIVVGPDGKSLANVLVYVKGRGVVIQEPSVVAVGDDNRIVAVGEDVRASLAAGPASLTDGGRFGLRGQDEHGFVLPQRSTSSGLDGPHDVRGQDVAWASRVYRLSAERSRGL